MHSLENKATFFPLKVKYNKTYCLFVKNLKQAKFDFFISEKMHFLQKNPSKHTEVFCLMFLFMVTFVSFDIRECRCFSQRNAYDSKM